MSGTSELVSFVVPAHNEADSLPLLVGEIRAVAGKLDGPWEIVIVDDGSTDGTAAWLEAEAREHLEIVALRFPSNRGQSAALAAGLAGSRGDILVTLDADLQNDPADVPRLLEALEGHDLVCGVRQTRQDSAAKRFGSRFANRFRRWWLKDGFRDVGCTLKAWRRPVADRIAKFDGFHRFLPILARKQGFRVTETEVSHRPRTHGATHYGNWGRAWRGLYDLVGVRWLLRRHIDARFERVPGAGERR